MTTPTHPLAGAVKPLEWNPGTFTTTDDDGGPREGLPRRLSAWRAGPYRIIRQHGEHGLYILNGMSDGIGQGLPTLEAAKTAAQSDYAARILSALEAPTPPADVAELVGRLSRKKERVHDLSGVYYREDLDCIEAVSAILTLSARVAELEAAELSAKHWHAKAEAALAGARDGAEVINDLPEGDVTIDIEHVYGGWCAYIFVYPQHGPIVPAEREKLHTRTPPMPSRAEAIAALPSAIHAMKGKP